MDLAKEEKEQGEREREKKGLIRWGSLNARQRNDLIARSVMGWVPGICSSEHMGEQPQSSDGWFCQNCGQEGYWGDDFEHEELPRRYSESMDAAWEIIQAFRDMNKLGLAVLSFCVTLQEECHSSPFSHIFSSAFVLEMTPEKICLAALQALGNVVEN